MSETRVLVAFWLSDKPTEALAQGQGVVGAMTGNANFDDPNPSLPTLTADLLAFSKAITDARNKIPGAVAARRTALIRLRSAFGSLKAFVQSVADADPENAEAIILSSGMKVRKTVVRNKTDFTATWGDVSGTVLLIARALADRASYLWQWSLDGATWNTLPSTLQADTTVHGLTPAKTYYFRFRVTLKGGEQDWSQIVSLLVK